MSLPRPGLRHRLFVISLASAIFSGTLSVSTGLEIWEHQAKLDKLKAEYNEALLLVLDICFSEYGYSDSCVFDAVAALERCERPPYDVPACGDPRLPALVEQSSRG